MSLPKSPYTRPNLPEVPGELDDDSLIQPNLFNRTNQHQLQRQLSNGHLSLSKNPLQGKILGNDIQARYDRQAMTNDPVAKVQLIKSSSGRDGPIPMNIPDEFDRNRGVHNQGNNQGGSQGNNQDAIQASQLTFNNDGVNRSLALASFPADQMQIMVDGMLRQEQKIGPKGAFSSDMNPFHGSNMNSRYNSESVLPDYSCDEDKESRRNFRRIKADQSRRSRSRSNHPGKPFPTFEPPVYIIDKEEIDDDEDRVSTRKQSFRSERNIFDPQRTFSATPLHPQERKSNTYSEMTVDNASVNRPSQHNQIVQITSLRQVATPSQFSRPLAIVSPPRSCIQQSHNGSPIRYVAGSQQDHNGSPIRYVAGSQQGSPTPTRTFVNQPTGQRISYQNSSEKLQYHTQVSPSQRYSYTSGGNIRILERVQPQLAPNQPEQKPSPIIEPLITYPSGNHSPMPVKQRESLLIPPPQSIEVNRLRESTMVTDELIKDRDNTTTRTSIPPLAIFNSALEIKSSLAYTTYHPPLHTPTENSVNPAREIKFSENKAGSVRNESSTYEQSQSRARFGSPPPSIPTYKPSGPVTEVQSERRVNTGPSFGENIRGRQDQLIQKDFIPQRIPNYTNFIQRQLSQEKLPNDHFHKPQTQASVLTIHSLPSIILPPQTSAINSTKYNELILENSRLRGEQAIHQNNLESALAQLKRLSNVETDFYLLLNHVTQAEAATHINARREKDETSASYISPVLLELLDVNSLLEKEKKKLDECIREREKVEGIIKGLKLRLRDQIGRYSSNTSELQQSRRSPIEHYGDQEEQYSNSERTLSNQQVNNLAHPTQQVDSELAQARDSSRVIDKNNYRASQSQMSYANRVREAAPLMYGSMMSDETSGAPSPDKLDYSVSQINDNKLSHTSENHLREKRGGLSQPRGNQKDFINLYSGENVRYNNDNEDLTPKLGVGAAKGQYHIDVRASSHQASSRNQAPLNAFESQDDTPRENLMMSKSVSNAGGAQSQKSKQYSDMQAGNLMMTSANPLAISRSFCSDNQINPINQQPAAYENGPFQITAQKLSIKEEASWAGAKMIVSRFGTIIPSKEKDDEVAKLREVVEKLARENMQLHDQIKNQKAASDSNSAKADRKLTPLSVNDPEISKEEEPKSCKIDQAIPIKLPKSGSFGDYSSSGGIPRKSAGFCEVNFDRSDDSKKKSNCSGESKLSPLYKNIDFFGDRPSLIQPKKSDFINIHEVNQQATPKPERVTHGPIGDGKNAVSIYSFLPSNEMLSMLNNGNPYEMGVNQIMNIFHTSTIPQILSQGQNTENQDPNNNIPKPATPVKDLLISEMNHDEPAKPDQEQEPADPRQKTMAKVAELYTMLKATRNHKKRPQSSKGEDVAHDDLDDDLPTRHAGGQEDDEINRPKSFTFKIESPEKTNIQCEVENLKNVIEELSVRVDAENQIDGTKAKIDDELRYLKARINEISNVDGSPARGDESSQSGNTSRLDDYLTVEDMKAKYLRLMQSKVDTSRRLKEEQDKSRKYREMIVAKLRAIDTMKDVYQRQIQRMVESECVDDDEDEEETYS